MRLLNIALLTTMCSMGTSQAVTPEDVMADTQQGVTLSGNFVRKGSVAATIANAQKYNQLTNELNQLIADIDSLLPSLHALGLLEFFPVETWLTAENEGKALVAILYLQKYPELQTEQVKEKLAVLKEKASPWLQTWLN